PAHGDRARHRARRADPAARRLPLQRGHADRGGDPHRAARRDAAAHDADRVAPGEHGPRGGPHPRARARHGRRARAACRGARARRALRGAAPRAAARRGDRGVVSELELDDGAGRAYDHRLGRRLLAYLRPYRGQVAVAVLVTLAAAAVQLAYPWLTKEAIDL